MYFAKVYKFAREAAPVDGFAILNFQSSDESA